VHGCTIEDGVLIGMGAIVMNGARVRKGCVVGAGAVITEGKDFPEKSLIIGAPAKAVRTLSDEVIAELISGNARYVANGKRFKAGLKKIG
jgi:carbonic anhydrase/acetyltransferase-like protein (isoleucine patch superfamily)